ncbi:MAG: GHMP kinase [Bacteroidetes bacterium]|nr:GHMP kinase [Bacteroidota bacterium]
MKSHNYYSHGKLLISGEYLVLDGALALVMPLKLGQSLLCEESPNSGLRWNAYHPEGCWFRAEFDLPTLSVKSATIPEIAGKLRTYLLEARKLNKNFLNDIAGYQVSTHMEFSREWGLGSSSTLTANIAAWAEIDAFDLHFAVSKGSGYDIAAALNPKPFLYQLIDHKPSITSVNFNPSFSDSLYFVYLGKKQNSESGISDYRKTKVTESDILKISDLTGILVSSRSLEEFQQVMQEHEDIISHILNAPKLSNTVFKDISCSAKSLGAWGGDFAMLATDIQESELKKMLNASGFNICFRFEELL